MAGREGDTATIGIDIGGTGTRFVATDPRGAVLRRSTVSTPSAFSSDGIGAVEFLTRQIRDILHGLSVDTVGIGASGPIDSLGIIRNPDTVPGFTGVDVTGGLEAALGVPVVIDNDAVCAAIAEQAVGAGRGSTSLLVVTLGTGIGTALLVDGSPVRGGDGQHPEGGHVSVPGETRPCYCGRASCWEQSASRQALQARAAEAVGRGSTSPAAIPSLVERAQAGDSGAGDIFAWYGSHVGEGLSSLLAVHRPQTVVFAGSAGVLLPWFEAGLRSTLERFGEWISSPALLATSLDDHGGAVGAALLAQRSLGGAQA